MFRGHSNHKNQNSSQHPCDCVTRAYQINNCLVLYNTDFFIFILRTDIGDVKKKEGARALSHTHFLPSSARVLLPCPFRLQHVFRPVAPGHSPCLFEDLINDSLNKILNSARRPPLIARHILYFAHINHSL